MDRYLILNIGRCGSSLLADLFAQYYYQKYEFDDIWTFEFFGRMVADYNLQVSKNRRKIIENEYNIVLTDDMPMKDIFKIVYERHLPVAKCISSQLLTHNMIFDILEYYNKMIILVRRNLLETVLSFCIMHKANINANLEKDNKHVISKVKSENFYIEKEFFLHVCSEIYEHLLLIENYIGKEDKIVFYEDIENMQPYNILKHCGVEDIDGCIFESKYIKLTSFDEKMSIIKNIDELQNYYKHTNLYQMEQIYETRYPDRNIIPNCKRHEYSC